jgi:D-amino-acid dehydrogenase
MMRIAVVGAGVVGLTTAQALQADGHEVTVFERRNTAATEASFSNAGFIAPGYVTPWAAPGMLHKVLRQWFQTHRTVRLARVPNATLWRWLWQWHRACQPARHRSNRQAMLALAQMSQQLTHDVARELRIDYERCDGVLTLLRDSNDVIQARAGLKLLAEAGLNFKLLDAAGCRTVEPALEAGTALKAGVWLGDAEVGNCRQFSIGLKAALLDRGVNFCFDHEVTALHPKGRSVKLRAHQAAQDVDSTLGLASVLSPGEPANEDFDAVVLCAAHGTPSLIRPLGVRLPIQAVHGYAITFPVRQFEAHPDVGPRSGLMDEQYKVAISRLGDRMRVAGGAELGGVRSQINNDALATLYKVVEDWFPSAARQAKAQVWKGARPMLPDGPPAIGHLGDVGAPGVWINSGHGSSGWALACGSARLVADAIAGRKHALDLLPFSPLRWRR